MENVASKQLTGFDVTHSSVTFFYFVAKAGICQFCGHNNVESCCNICDILQKQHKCSHPPHSLYKKEVST